MTLYGDFRQEEFSAIYWLKKNKDILPPFRFDCGTNDHLLEENRQLHRSLTTYSIAHEYFEFDGDHSWAYWQKHIVDTLLFFESR